MQVYREVYYTAPVWARAAGRAARLGADEYYVLGDNSAISQDSRTWTDHPAVGDKCLVGKPLAIFSPSGEFDWGNWHFQVPNLSRIRYIR